MPAFDFEFINFPFAQTGNKYFPYTRGAANAQRMAPAVPPIEVAYYAHAQGIRRPDGKRHAGNSLQGGEMRSELFIRPVVRTFRQQVKIEVRKYGREPIRILKFILSG